MGGSTVKTSSGDDAATPVCADEVFRPAIVTPTYNNAATLIDVLQRTERIGAAIVVVNDGSTDDTAGLLTEWQQQPHRVDVFVVVHEENQGKAAALQTGFAYAKDKCFTHCATMDTDGQLDPAELPSLLEAARRSPASLVLGRRREDTPGLPKSNLVGWYTSALGLWQETGRVVHDSQCGLRVYPLALFEVVSCSAGRFGFETEIIARAVWAGCGIVEVPVSCIYYAEEERVSHIRPVRDGVQGFFMHWRLAIRRFIPRRPSALIRREGCADVAETTPADVEWSIAKWLNPFSYLRLIRSSRLEQLLASSAIAHGAFMACLPLGGWSFLAAAYGSWRLHHNFWATMLGACMGLGAVGAILARTSITIVYWPLHLRLPGFEQAAPGVESVVEVLRFFPISWPLGGVLVGTVLHWVIIAGLFFLYGRLVRTRT